MVKVGEKTEEKKVTIVITGAEKKEEEGTRSTLQLRQQQKTREKTGLVVVVPGFVFQYSNLFATTTVSQSVTANSD